MTFPEFFPETFLHMNFILETNDRNRACMGILANLAWGTFFMMHGIFKFSYEYVFSYVSRTNIVNKKFLPVYVS